MFKRNSFPIWAFSTSSSRVLGSFIEIFSAAITKSPLLKPAFSAGLLGITDWIRAPFLSGNWTNELGSRLCSLAILGFKEINCTPKYGWITSPFLRSWSETLLAKLIGIAKPKPAPGPLLTNVFIPITSPLEFMSGPPELPGFIAASVWIRSSLLSENPKLLISLCRLLTIPKVTVFSRP